ncbi:ABC transporter transmembrane domain-containing protein, partial [Stenotrophomonas maltophilia]
MSRNTSETISRIQEVRQISINVLQPMLQLASSIAVGVLVIGTLIFLNPFVAVSSFLMLGGVYFVIGIILRRKISTNAKIMESLRSKRIQVAQESLGGIRDVLLDSSQKVFVDQFTEYDAQISKAQAANNFAQTAPRYSVEACGMVLITFVAFYF